MSLPACQKMKVAPFLLGLVQILLHCSAETTTCDLRETKYGHVCVCTNAYCDYLDDPEPHTDNELIIISSSKDGLRFATTAANFTNQRTLIVENYRRAKHINFDPIALIVHNNTAALEFAESRFLFRLQGKTKTAQLTVDRAKRYQKIISFGGAFTGAVSFNLQLLDQTLQDHLYKSYFHKSGIKYNTVRLPIGGCDFDIEPWAYNEQPQNDARLSNFTKLDERDELKILQLQRLKNVTNLDQLKIMAAAWSSPTWMKSNQRWTGFSHLKPEYYQTWADYHLRFAELMNAKNMPIWAISTGNEPLNGVVGMFFVNFMSLGWTPSNQAVWLSEYLGPTFKKSAYKNILIFGNDDQRYTYPTWFRKMNESSSKALDYLNGLAVHWYWDEVFSPVLIDLTLQLMPDKLLLNTESCVGDKPWTTHGPELGSWERGEQYMRAYMQDLQHSFNGWIDWNIVLDEQGGPNYVQNYVDAPIIINTTNGKEFYKQPIFYAIGHYSKFIPEGSERIDIKLSNNAINAVGFQRPDGSIALIIYNGGDTLLNLTLSDSVRGQSVLQLPSRSWHTIIYK